MQSKVTNQPQLSSRIQIYFLFQSTSGTRLRRSASASRRDSKDSKFREKIAELEDIIRHQTKEFDRTNNELVRH
jgi:hypothetical protein